MSVPWRSGESGPDCFYAGCKKHCPKDSYLVTTWLLVALGGAAGSVLRYSVGRLAVAYLGPTTVLGTFIVNVTGSFALGFFMALTFQRIPVPVEFRGLVAVGFLGGYTTFSTLSFESILLLESGEVWKAGASLLGNLVLGLSAAYLGMWLARAL